MNEWVSEWVNDWMNEWVSEWVSEWMNERMDEWMTCGSMSEIQVINKWIGKSQIIHKKHSDQIMKFTKQGIYCQSVHSVGMSEWTDWQYIPCLVNFMIWSLCFL